MSDFKPPFDFREKRSFGLLYQSPTSNGNTSAETACLPVGTRRRSYQLYALVIVALTACTIFDLDQLARKGWERGADVLGDFFSSGSKNGALHSVLEYANIGDVVWGKCDDPSAVPAAECGYAIVPLDYFDESAGKVKIALGRYNATSGPRRGSLFVNPGGPGGPGVSLATQAGPSLQHILGGEYDIIGFDPRGIGQTEPATRCFPEPGARTAFIANTVLDRGYDSSTNYTDERNRYHLIESQRDANGLFKAQFAICSQTMGETIRYMGTSSVVRDIDYVTTLLDGEDAMINFYGLSYGTVIGQYLVNMFPERVGHVAIDGNVDVDVWANTPPYKWFGGEWLSSTEDEYDLFFEGCAQSGPTGCALAKKEGESPASIKSRVESFMQELLTSPMPVPNATAPGILTLARARYFQVDALVSPGAWPQVASALAKAIAGDGSDILNAVNAKDLVDLERSAVTCNDARPFPAPSPEEFIDAQLQVMENVTRFGLAVVTHEPDSGCEFWPVAPPERYLGPWNKTLANPILIVSNTLDPVTSLANGKSVLNTMGENAGLLVQNGPGHCSLALPSSCTSQHMRNFFANGTLPQPGTVCEVDVSPFPGLSMVSELDADARLLHESVKKVAKVALRRWGA